MEHVGKRILDKLDKIQEDVSDLKVENAKQSINIEINTKDLTEHIEGVKQVRKMIQDHKADDVSHKVPMTVKALCIKLSLVFGGIGTIAGAVYGILRIINM